MVREATELADHIGHLSGIYAENIRYWADPSQTPTLGVARGPGERTEEQCLADAEAMVVTLRRALAVLQGTTATPGRADEVERSDERGLLRLVEEAAELAALGPATEGERRAWVEGREWLYATSPPRTPATAVDYLLRRNSGRFSLPTFQVLCTVKNRLLIAQSAGLRAGVETWRGYRPPRVALWLVPLFEVAAQTNFVGKCGDAKSWAENLRNRGLLPKEKPKS